MANIGIILNRALHAQRAVSDPVDDMISRAIADATIDPAEQADFRTLLGTATLPASARARVEALLERKTNIVALRASERANVAWAPDKTPEVMDLSQPLRFGSRSEITFRVDGDALADMGVRLRRVVDESGRACLEAHFELRPRAGGPCTEKLLALGARFRPMPIGEATKSADGRWVFEPTKDDRRPIFGTLEALTLRSALYEVRAFPEQTAPQALRGKMRIRGFGASEAEQRANLELALKVAGCDAVLAPSTERSRTLHQRMRLLWQADPRAARTLSRKSVKATALTKALAQAGVPQDAAASVRYAEVFPGYFAAVVPGMAERYRNRGVRGLVHTSNNAAAVAVMLCEGLLSTNERIRCGVHVAGISSDVDLETGGADFVFTRLLVDTSRVSPHDLGRFNLLIDPRVLDRTDWFAYTQDEFGATSVEGDRGRLSPALKAAFGEREIPYSDRSDSFLERPTGKKLLEDIRKNDDYGLQNEAMFKVGIAAAHIRGVIVSTEAHRKELLAELAKRGVREVNGWPAEAFVQVQEQLLETTSFDGGGANYV